MMRTSNDRSRGGAQGWMVRSLVVMAGAAILILLARRSSRPVPTAQRTPTTPTPFPAQRASDDEDRLDPELPERDVLHQRQAAVPEAVDELPTTVPSDEPEADVLEHSREVTVEEDPPVVDEPPRDG